MNPKDQTAALDIAPQETVAITPVGASPLSLIERMIDSGKLTAESVSVVERLVALHEHMEDKKAEKQFAEAFAALQNELKTFQATKIVPDKQGKTRYTYLPYEEIMREVNPLAQRHGFSISFSTDCKDARIVQTCTLQHNGGHHRDYQAFVRAGAGPYGATETQADGAAMTYAKRYALCNALNITVEHDSDGASQDARDQGGPIASDKVQYLREELKEAGGTEAGLCQLAGVAKLEDVPSAVYPVLVRAIEARKRAKK
jgi:hypothetical protein